MIESQLRPSKVIDARVLGAFAGIRRELFVSEHLRTVAYVDEDLPLGGGRYLMEPMVAARLLQAAAIERTDTVLIVGAGYGLRSRSRRAAGTERRRPRRGSRARPACAGGSGRAFHRLGQRRRGTPAAGLRPRAPYDVILFGGAVAEVPSEIDSQLAEGGRLLAVVKSANGIGRATLRTRTGGVVSQRFSSTLQSHSYRASCRSPPLCFESSCSDAHSC